MNKTISDFTISWGSGFSDPVWGYDNYHVLEHKSDYVYIYMRPSDKAIEFIVDSSPGDGVDRVMYYPSGLTADNTVNGVWDYDLRYASCGNNYTSFSFSKKIFGSKLAKPSANKPKDLNAKPRPEAVSAIGGVRALFHSKNSQPKSMMSAPNKATFLINKEQKSEQAPMNLFMSKSGESKMQTLFKAAKTQNLASTDKLAKFKAFASTMKPKNLASSATEAQVDYVFSIADTNRDGALSRAEIKAAATAMGEPCTDADLEMAFMMIDANKNNLLEKSEINNFLTIMGGVQLYTKSEQVDLIFQYYDYNLDGYLSKSEIKALLIDAYGYATDADAEWFVAVVDSNWDGKISWYELYYAIQ